MNFDNKTAAAVLRRQNYIALKHTSSDVVNSLREKDVPESILHIIEEEIRCYLPDILQSLESIFQKLEDGEIEFDDAVRQTIKLSAELSFELGTRAQKKMADITLQPLKEVLAGTKEDSRHHLPA